MVVQGTLGKAPLATQVALAPDLQMTLGSTLEKGLAVLVKMNLGSKMTFTPSQSAKWLVNLFVAVVLVMVWIHSLMVWIHSTTPSALMIAAASAHRLVVAMVVAMHHHALQSISATFLQSAMVQNIKVRVKVVCNVEPRRCNKTRRTRDATRRNAMMRSIILCSSHNPSMMRFAESAKRVASAPKERLKKR